MKKLGQKGQVIVCLVLLAGATLATYFCTLDGEFVYDDPILITENPLVTGDDTGIGAIFRSEFFGGGGGQSGFYRPLMVLVYRIEYSLFGPDPFYFHLFNVLTHTAAAAVLFWLMLAVGIPLLAALGGALLFALHPVNVESVAWIAAGANAMAFLFTCLSLVFIVRFARQPAPNWKSLDLWAAVLTLVPALLVKETALIVPAMAFLFIACRLPGQRHRQAGRLLFFLPFLVVAAFFVLVHVLVVGGDGDDLLFQGGGETADRLVTFLDRVPAYLKLIVWPSDLNIARPVRLAESAFSLPVLAGGVIVLLALGLLLWSWKRGRRDLLCGAALALFSLLSLSTVIPIAYAFREMDFPFFERYLYLTVAGISFLVAAALGRTALRAGSASDMKRSLLGMPLTAWPAIMLVGALAVVLALSSKSRARDWRDDRTLFTRAVELFPGSPSLNVNKGFALQAAGEHKMAIKAFENAALLDPTLAMARINQAISLNEIGATVKAEALLREILQKEPDNQQALRVLGSMLAWRGELEAAFGLYCRAFRITGGDAMLERNLSLLLQNMRLEAEKLYLSNRKDEAVALADLVLADVPKTAWAWEVKGYVLTERGEGREGVVALERAVSLSRDSLVAAARLAEIYRRQGLESKALEMELYIEEGRKRIPEGSIPEIND